MGNGFNRVDPLVFWQVTGTNTSTWTWSGTMASGNFSGYLYGSGASLRWGTGALNGTDAGSDGAGYLNFIYSTFQGANGSGMGAPGDSGGGMFYKRGSNWELAGILITIANYPNQPGNTSVVGDATYAADLSVYRSQITTLAAVQQPVFTTQPAGITVTEGQSGTFTASATAAPACPRGAARGGTSRTSPAPTPAPPPGHSP
jgi:hypothetical protein